MPARFADLKRALLPADDVGKKRFVQAWEEVLVALKAKAREVQNAKDTSEIIPVVEFADLSKISKEDVERIKRIGTVVIRNVIDDAQATAWKEELKVHVKSNPVEGIPDNDKQFFMLYWTRPQVQARADPNVLAATVWLNNLYNTSTSTTDSDVQNVLKDVKLSTPLVYADRFRIRHPGNKWNQHPPHIDGGSIERWEDTNFRSCFADILDGNWRKHDPYALEGRLNAKISLYGRAGQASVFRTFQGWLALSETGPGLGTLKVFPDVQLSNAYLIMRPFFRPKEKQVTEEPLDAENWELDTTSPEFPGIFATPSSYRGPRLLPPSHPHMQLPITMTSCPHVNPGDMVFWHCDVVHSVEVDHIGTDDSAVMYIPAVPSTKQNEDYLVKQLESFKKGIPPPDFPRTVVPEGGWEGTGVEQDVVTETGKRAMGLAY